MHLTGMLLIALLISFSSNFSFAGPNDSNLTTHEQNQQDLQKNRQEINNATITPNTPSTPTKVDVSSWGLGNYTFQITNHLFGYSTLIDKDYTFDGVKLTGFINIAFYSPRKNNDGDRKKGRFVIGLEDNIISISNRSSIFLGGGFTLGDEKGLYLDTGLDFYILTWLKTQIGVNYQSANAHISPQLSLGITW